MKEKQNQKANLQNMLEHQIVVLQNVSDNSRLFRKELEKSKKWLNDNELIVLKKWLLNKYQHKYYELIHEMLDGSTLSKMN